MCDSRGAESGSVRIAFRPASNPANRPRARASWHGGFRLGYLEAPFDTGTLALSPGIGGTYETVLVMQRLAVQGAGDARTRLAAENIVRGVPARAWGLEAVAICRWVKRHMRYTRDGLTAETLRSVERMLEEIEKHGKTLADCDDAAILIAALLLTLGHAPAFQVLGRGSVPHHVNVLDRTTGMELDPTGEPSGTFAFRQVFPVVGGD